MTRSNRRDPAVLVVAKLKQYNIAGKPYGTHVSISSSSPLGITNQQTKQPQFIGLYHDGDLSRFLITLSHPGSLKNLISIGRYFSELPDCLDNQGTRSPPRRILWLSAVKMYSSSLGDKCKAVRMYIPKIIDLGLSVDSSERPGLIRVFKVLSKEFMFLDIPGYEE